MATSNKLTLTQTLIGGLAVGYLATQALDVVSTYLYQKEDRDAFDKENKARNGATPMKLAYRAWLKKSVSN